MRSFFISLLSCLAITTYSANLRLAVLDFDNASGIEPAKALGISLDAQALSENGALFLNLQLLNKGNFTVIDRRDFISKVSASIPSAIQKKEKHISFINAAQLLNIDAVMRGSIMSLSRSKRTLNPTQTGAGIDIEVVNIRVMLQALNAIDGTVLSAAQGKSSREFRQSGAEQTVLGEDDLLDLLEDAISDATDNLTDVLPDRISKLTKRELAHITVKTTEDPALVEIDGVLVGSTPMTNLEVYKGDHTLTISRPNYQSISKSVVIKSDLEINAPMFRLDLTAKERKEIYSNVDMKMYLTNGKPDIMIQEIR